jgi:hypothetical protein
MASFYADVANKNYVNTYYALCIAFDDYIANKLLNGDHNRIVTCSTEYALIKRSGTNEWNNANLPFVNYTMSSKVFGGNRNWFSMEGYSQGIFIPELRKKLRITPIEITLDCSYWTGREDDRQYAIDQLIIDNSAETKLKFQLDYGGVLVNNIAVIDFDLDTSIKFTEQDWLNQNNIKCVGINPTIQTYLTRDSNSGFCIPKKILMNFLVKKDIINQGEVIEYEQAMEFLIDHFNQRVTI